jgi:hypothetical protein
MAEIAPAASKEKGPFLLSLSPPRWSSPRAAVSDRPATQTVDQVDVRFLKNISPLRYSYLDERGGRWQRLSSRNWSGSDRGRQTEQVSATSRVPTRTAPELSLSLSLSLSLYTART